MSSRVVSVFGPDADELLTSSRTLVIFLSSVLMMMNAEMVSPLLPAIMDAYTVSESQIGLVMAALTLPPVVFVPVMGIAADKLSRRVVLGSSLLLTGVAGLGIVFTQTYEQLIALRVLQGIGYSGVQPITVTLLGDLYTKSTETTAQGLRTFFNNVAGSLLPPIGGFLLLVSWKAPFLLYVIHIPVAIFAFVMVPLVSSQDEGTDDKKYARQIAQLLARKKILLLFFAGFTMFFLRYGLITYLPLLLTREFGLSTSSTGIFVGLSTACAAIGASQAGRLSHHFSQKRTLQTGLLIAGLAFVVLPLTNAVSIVVTGAVIVCYGFFWGITSPTQKSLINQIVSARVRAGTISASYTVQNLGKAVAPVGGGIAIALMGYQIGFALLGVLPLVTAVSFYYYR